MLCEVVFESEVTEASLDKVPLVEGLICKRKCVYCFSLGSQDAGANLRSGLGGWRGCGHQSKSRLVTPCRRCIFIYEEKHQLFHFYTLQVWRSSMNALSSPAVQMWMSVIRDHCNKITRHRLLNGHINVYWHTKSWQTPLEQQIPLFTKCFTK